MNVETRVKSFYSDDLKLFLIKLMALFYYLDLTLSILGFNILFALCGLRRKGVGGRNY